MHITDLFQQMPRGARDAFAALLLFAVSGAALVEALRAGGVGHYAKSDFIHVDTGRAAHLVAR